MASWMVRGEYVLIRDYFRAYRRHFKRAVGLAAVLLLILEIISFYLRFFLFGPIPWLQYFAVMWVYFLIAWALMSQYAYAALVRRERTVWQTLKVAALLALDNIVASLVVLLAGGVLVVLSVWLAVLLVLFLGGTLAFLHCTAYESSSQNTAAATGRWEKAKGRQSMAKYVFITGGVVSGLGKGITAASLGRLLKSRGINVTIAKLDPYINVDPGTMSPLQHGEVFVTDDGAETDLDLGHYERFMDVNLTKMSNVTTGQDLLVHHHQRAAGRLFGRHRASDPPCDQRDQGAHPPRRQETGAEVAIIEIGGTVGDIESLPFLEAIRQMRSDVGREYCLYIHVTLVPYVGSAGELKTKPTQHSVKELRQHRDSARHHRLPLGGPACRGHQTEDRAVLRHRAGGGDPQARRRTK